MLSYPAASFWCWGKWSRRLHTVTAIELRITAPIFKFSTLSNIVKLLSKHCDISQTRYYADTGFSKLLSPLESSNTAILSAFSYASLTFLTKVYIEHWAEKHTFKVLCDSQLSGNFDRAEVPFSWKLTHVFIPLGYNWLMNHSLIWNKTINRKPSYSVIFISSGKAFITILHILPSDSCAFPFWRDDINSKNAFALLF